MLSNLCHVCMWQVREAADTDLELESGGELLDSSQIVSGSSAQPEPASSAPAEPRAAAAATAAAAQQLPAEELEEAEASRQAGASTDAGPWHGGWEAIGPGGGAGDVEPPQMSEPNLEERLAGQGLTGPAGSVRAAGGGLSEQEPPAGDASEPVQASAVPVSEEGAAAVTGS